MRAAGRGLVVADGGGVREAVHFIARAGTTSTPQREQWLTPPVMALKAPVDVPSNTATRALAIASSCQRLQALCERQLQPCHAASARGQLSRTLRSASVRGCCTAGMPGCSWLAVPARAPPLLTPCSGWPITVCLLDEGHPGTGTSGRPPNTLVWKRLRTCGAGGAAG